MYGNDYLLSSVSLAGRTCYMVSLLPEDGASVVCLHVPRPDTHVIIRFSRAARAAYRPPPRPHRRTSHAHAQIKQLRLVFSN